MSTLQQRRGNVARFFAILGMLFMIYVNIATDGEVAGGFVGGAIGAFVGYIVGYVFSLLFVHESKKRRPY